jgi:hypothetical protein
VASKIKGGPPPVDRTSAVDPTDSVRAPEATKPVEPAQPAERAGALDPVARVAARLRAGEIGADEAVELLIDDAVERQLGKAIADKPELAQKLRDLLRQHAANDPHLAAHIRRLTQAK